jgi:WD40 repeat protein
MRVTSRAADSSRTRRCDAVACCCSSFLSAGQLTRHRARPQIITSSGDSTCILWNVETKTPTAIFNDHTGDVMSVSVFDSKDIFVSGSCDATAKLWDHRQNGKNCIKTFGGHESDINSVQIFPDGACLSLLLGLVFTWFLSLRQRVRHGLGRFVLPAVRHSRVHASKQVREREDSLRHHKRRVLANRQNALRRLRRLRTLLLPCCCLLLRSCAYAVFDVLFAAQNCYVWDTQHGVLVDQLIGHDNRVSCLGVSDDGKALATGYAASHSSLLSASSYVRLLVLVVQLLGYFAQGLGLSCSDVFCFSMYLRPLWVWFPWFAVFEMRSCGSLAISPFPVCV